MVPISPLFVHGVNYIPQVHVLNYMLNYMSARIQKTVMTNPSSTLSSYNQALTDIFGSLDEVQNCLDKAPSNEAACLEGIQRADTALRMCPGDVSLMSPLKMKRAELLFIAVSPSQHCLQFYHWIICIYMCIHSVISPVYMTDPSWFGMQVNCVHMFKITRIIYLGCKHKSGL